MRITCVHQGFELYGSDRSFVESVRVLRAAYPQAEIDVVLPRRGPIVAPLTGLATRILIDKLWVLRRRDLPRLIGFGFLTLPLAVARAARRIARSDVTYVNTSVVADYLLAARFCPGRTLLHVHEIPEGATLAVLKALVRWSGTDVIFNSRATQAAFGLPAEMRARVVYNGIAGPGAAEPKTYDGRRPLRLLMLGRISRIKGQEVLVEAVRRLPVAIRERLEIRIVGNAYEDPDRERALAEAIAAAGLSEVVTLRPFVDDPSDLYRWADVVVVPSRLPESLGRVAIEAMSYGRPPIVSRIGGLTEIVVPNRTGWVVEPDDAVGLSACLERIVLDPQGWTGYPAAARARYDAVFRESVASEGLLAMVRSRLDATMHRGRAAVATTPVEP